MIKYFTGIFARFSKKKVKNEEVTPSLDISKVSVIIQTEDDEVDSPSDSDVENDSEDGMHYKGGITIRTLDDYIKFNRFLAEIEDANQLRKAKKDDNELRNKHAKKAYWLTSVWLLVIVSIIYLKGFKGIKLGEFILDKTEFLTVIGTLTTSVFAFYMLVIRYLFYKPENDSEKKNKKADESKDSKSDTE